MTCIAIIPARGGSRRIPRKNIKLFHGKPIIAYSIETALESCLFHHVFVTTDDDDIETVSRSCGAGILRRSVAMAADDVGTQEVARDALCSLHNLESFLRYEIACVIYATAPLMSPIDLAQGLADLHESRKAFAYSVDLVERDVGQFYWGHAWAFLGRVPLYNNASVVRISNDRVCDINWPQDWARAEQMYAALQEKK